jgi:fucose 4-O-acetylase-like acetyltransferase
MVAPRLCVPYIYFWTNWYIFMQLGRMQNNMEATRNLNLTFCLMATTYGPLELAYAILYGNILCT